jgi:hypothetical protein
MNKWEWVLLGLAVVAILVAVNSYSSTIVPPYQAVTLPDGTTNKPIFTIGLNNAGNSTNLTGGVKL